MELPENGSVHQQDNIVNRQYQPVIAIGKPGFIGPVKFGFQETPQQHNRGSREGKNT